MLCAPSQCALPFYRVWLWLGCSQGSIISFRWRRLKGVAIVGNIGFLPSTRHPWAFLRLEPQPISTTGVHCDKMSDRETLLSMGFDPSRVDCECYPPSTCIYSPSEPPCPHPSGTFCCAGALKATNNRGLQPAMDHLIENESNPVPDLSSVSSTTTSTRPPGGGDPMDEDEDLEALRAVYGTGADGSTPTQAEAEAKVSFRPTLTKFLSR